MNIREKFVADGMKRIADTRDLYGELGYPEEKIKKLLGPKRIKFLELYDCVVEMQQLFDNAEIARAKIRQIKRTLCCFFTFMLS